MTNEKAKAILTKEGYHFTENRISNSAPYVDIIDHKCQSIRLDGSFDVEEVQAIAQWLADPVGVINA